MKRFAIVICLATLLSPAAVRAGFYGTELPFVAGSGARLSGMGLAGTSLTGVSSSQHANPATLAEHQYRQLELYRTTLFDSKSSYIAASYTHPTLDFGTLGLSLLRVGVGGIEERDEFNSLLSSDLTSSAMRVLLGYAAGVTRALSLGVNLKIDHQKLAGVSGTGVGADLGAVATHAFSEDGLVRRARVGVMLENVVEPSVKLDAEDVADPMRIAAGTSFDARTDRVGITASMDVVSPRYSPFQFRAGLEIDYDRLVAVRAGLDDDTPTFGLGVSYRGAHVDYAFRDEDLGNNHRFSIAIAFGASTSDRKHAREARLDAEMHDRLGQSIREFEDGQLKRLVARADSLFAAGDYAAANEQYGSVLAWDPSHQRAAGLQRECRFHMEVARGRERAANNDQVTALYHYRQADALRPGDSGVASEIARYEQRIRESQDRAVMVDALLRRSIDLYAQGQFADALPGFREVLRNDPHNGLAREYEKKTAVSIASAVEQALTRARARAERGDFQGAIDLLAQARALSPDDTRIEAELAGVRESQRSRAEKAATEVAPAPEERAAGAPADESMLLTRYREGVRLFEQGLFDAAAKELLFVWTAAPGFRDVADTLARALMFLGLKAYSKGSYDEAIATWERVLTIDPDNAKARRYLKNAREEASRLGAARP